MNISERYVAAYVIECLTGSMGAFPDYIGVVKQARVQHPLLKQVLEVVRGQDLRAEDTKRTVVQLVTGYISQKYTATINTNVSNPVRDVILGKPS